MGTILKVLGALFLLLIGAFGALLIWSHGKGAETQEAFFAAVTSGETDQVTALFHPELAAIIDEPVLAVWMNAVRENLGTYQGLKASAFSTASRTENGANVVESEGTVEFEKGEARSELRLVDGKVVKFLLLSDAMPDPWFTELPDASRYVEKGRECLEKLLGSDIAGASALMHENLQKELPPEALEPGMAALRGLIGDVESVTPTSETFTPGAPPQLRILYQVKAARGEIKGEVVYDFTPWQGQLLGIDVPVD